MSTIKGVHHIGIAVRDLNITRAILEKITGVSFSEKEDVPSQKVAVSFGETEGTRIELIQATDKKSPLFPLMEHPILSFINKHGEGIHHICFEVDNIEATISDLKDAGIQPLRDDVMEGSSGGRIIFLNPNDTNGLLIELRE